MKYVYTLLDGDRILRYVEGVYNVLIKREPDFGNGTGLLPYYEYIDGDWYLGSTNCIATSDRIISRKELIKYKIMMELEK